MSCFYTHRLRLHRSYWGLRWWFCWTPERYTTGPYSSLCIWTAVGETNGRAAKRSNRDRSGVRLKRWTGNYILVLLLEKKSSPVNSLRQTKALVYAFVTSKIDYCNALWPRHTNMWDQGIHLQELMEDWEERPNSPQQQGQHGFSCVHV